MKMRLEETLKKISSGILSREHRIWFGAPFFIE